MGQLIAKEAAGMTYHVRRLTVREIYRLFDQREEAPPLDLLGNTLFEELTLEDILTFTDLSREQLLDLLPTDVETIIAEIKRENPHFFAALQRLRGIGERLGTLMNQTSSPSNVQSSP